MAPGAVVSKGHQGPEPIAFRLKDRPLFSLFSSDVPASAQMCLTCGFIELWGDMQTARRVLGRDS